MSLWDVLLVVVLGSLGVVGVWFPVMLFAALFSGWWELAKAFPAYPSGDGATRGAGSVVFSPLFRYRGIVHFRVDEDTLHLSMLVVGVFHAPISLPFAEMTFFAGDRVVLGMIPVEVSGRRLLMSRSMLERETTVRRELGLLHPRGEIDPADVRGHADEPEHMEHAHAAQENAR